MSSWQSFLDYMIRAYEESLRKRREQQAGSWIHKTDDSFWAPAKNLDISWAGKNSNRYWHWQDSGAAELQQSRLVEINTTFDTSRLSQGKKYEVFFMLKLIDSARGWDSPVKLKLSFPDNQMELGKKDLSKLLKNNNIFKDVLVGEFEASADNKGMLGIQLFQKDSDHTKTGLVVDGVKIVPKDRPGVMERKGKD